MVLACFALASGVFASRTLGQVPVPGSPDESGNHRTAGVEPGMQASKAPMPEWGTTSANWMTIGSGSFTPITSGWTWGQNFWWRWGTTGGVTFWDASLSLPSGTKVTHFVVEAYDSSASGDVRVTFATCPNLSSTCTYTGLGQTSGTPGYTWLTVVLPSPITIDNNMNSYHIRVRLDSGDDTNSFRSVSFKYELQVSPAPGVATFGDVPTGHPFFKFVEALYASGITAGCGGGNFCPDSPLTRGQMAVFLSVALGLHWPN
jgi:hypothetical protein